MTTKLTALGVNVMTRALDGDTITFTHIQLGNGAAQIAADTEALNNPLLTLGIDEIKVEDRKAALSVSFQNSQLDAGFRWTEAGIFCKDPDDSSAELLYAYGYEPEATADYIAASDDQIQEMQLQFLAYVSDAENITAVINQSTVYVTKAALDAHLADHANPHTVTKEQVGLGNVPNLAPEDMAPPYTEPAGDALIQPQSGNTISTFFGRVSKAVRALISHLADNVRHVSAAERIAWNSKANASHAHSTADITSGTLGAARGGTGCTTLKEAGKTIVPYFFDGPPLIPSGNSLDDVISPGFYHVAQSDAGKPSGAPDSAGFLLVFSLSTNAVTQIFISQGTPSSGEQKVWTRNKIDSDWRPWA